MTIDRNIVLALPAALLIGCGPVPYQGTVEGEPVAVSDAVFARSKTGVIESLQILAGPSGVCEDAVRGAATPNSTWLSLGLLQGSFETGKPYDVTISLKGTLVAQVIRMDSSCKDTLGRDGLASGGTVTFDRLDEKAVVGSFDLKFGSENLKGAFTALPCETGTLPAKSCAPKAFATAWTR